MPKFGSGSLENLEGVHPLLVALAHWVVNIFDVSIIYGKRSEEEQKELYAIGRTKELDRDPVTNLDGVKKKSKHQVQEDGFAWAIDVAPYPVSFENKRKVLARFYMMAGYFFAGASILLKGTGYAIRWGGDWDTDKEFTDQNFDDLPHIELVKI